MADVKLTALSLGEVADYLEILASDQRAATRWASRQKDKAECFAKALAYDDAASIVRSVTLIPPETDLLAACKAMEAYMTECGYFRHQTDMAKLARGAIRKATGGQP